MTKTHLLPRHRHFVAAPLIALFLILVAAVNRTLPVGAAFAGSLIEGVITTQSQEQQFETPAGITAVALPDSVILISGKGETLTLTHGSVLVKASGFVRVIASKTVAVDAFHGSVLVLKDTSSVTIVALQSAAAVDHGEISLLPAGYQMRIATDGSVKRSAVPAQWFRQQHSKAISLPETSFDASLQPLASSILGATNLTDDFVTESLHSADELHDSGRALLVSATLVTKADQMDSSGSALIAHDFLSRITLPEERAFAVAALARSTLKPLPVTLVKAWQKAALHVVSGDPVLGTMLFTDILDELPDLYASAGYPKQSEIWADAISGVSSVLSSLIPSKLPVAEVAPEPEVKLSSEEVQAAAEQILLDHDAMFTATTVITVADGAQCAEVTDIFLSQNGRDTGYSFSLCPVKNLVKDIVRDGVKLPNSVPISAFF